MRFTEFSEFSNPLEKDYDINSSFEPQQQKTYVTNIGDDPMMDLIDLIGFPEDVTDEELREAYGISMQEYQNPTPETVMKVRKRLEKQQNTKHR